MKKKKELGEASPMAALPWMNGERAVVVLYIARILCAAPFSLLLYESISLSIVSLFAIFLDIFADRDDPFSQFFTTRPGASSGILLGAVTLPGLMLSRLVQMSRGLSSNEVGFADFEYFRLQYWAASASCFCVLAFLQFVLHRRVTNTQSVGSCRDWKKISGVCCIALYAGICCIALGAKNHFGWKMELILFWVACHGSSAVKLIQSILQTFPACASIGETLLVTSGLVVYFGDMVALVVGKIYGYLTSPNFPSVQYFSRRSEISIIVQGMTLGLLLFPMIFKFIYQIAGCFNFQDMRPNNEIKKSLIFFGSLVFMLIAVVPSWMQFVQDFHSHPLLWVLDFVFSEPLKRLSLCTYWIALTYVSVTRFYHISKNSKIERILLRKYYHLMAVLMFVPALIFQPKFLDLAFGAALAVFLILEIIRVSFSF
ncbi:OLC1v1003811C4 [Oldenlandia corymbosa var. corymbosa]|uniref:dolichol kinase n=1 Tax=Oldenlandia corymbosa var. corymbosa TaxID=529605 RepID=A0AAV1DD77_OLDCO|nr:OLC1v1003811C4 [Oldenlandia corymbosa var. corymbosa]